MAEISSNICRKLPRSFRMLRDKLRVEPKVSCYVTRMTFKKSRYLSVTFGLLATSATCTTLLACSQSPPEAPTEEYRRREPMWLSGEVMGVDRIPVDEYNESTMQLIVTTETDENVRLKLGPGWYMEENGLTFEPQQHIEFRGQHNPDGSYVAHSLRRGQRTIEIRNPDGSPRWQDRSKPNSGSPAAAPASNSTPSGATPQSGAP